MTPSAVELLNQVRPIDEPHGQNPAVADVSVEDFLLDGRPLQADVASALIDVGLDRRIDGASTLTPTLSDPKLTLLNSGLFKRAVDLELNDLPFRLVGLRGGQGQELELSFEARAVARLRRFSSPLAASRADVTRAEFIKRMCDEAGVEFICPQLHKRQPIAKPSDGLPGSRKSRERHPAIKETVALTVKGVPADSAQIRTINRVLDVARSVHSIDLATLAMIVANVGEAGYRTGAVNPTTKAAGLFQLLPSTQRAFGLDPADVEGCANRFLTGGKDGQGFTGAGGAIKAAREHPDWSPGKIAAFVEGSDANAAFYDRWRQEADAIFEAYGGQHAFGTAATREYAKSYVFRRGAADGQPEDSWTCMRRLADEVRWRLWEEADAIYFMTDDEILASGVRYTVVPGATGVDSVSFDLHVNKPVQEVTIECRARRWAAPPATVVELEGYGPANGRWITAHIERESLFTDATTVTLHRREKAKLEPAHDLATTQGGEVNLKGGTLVGGTLRDRVAAAAAHAAELSKANPAYYHYSQAGAWKNDLFKKDEPGDRSDCSSFVILCYAKAGCKLPPSLKGQGFTGSLAAAGRKVSAPKPGDIALYGAAPNYEHVELYVGAGKTIGHGSARVDYDTPGDPALPQPFAGYWTFDFLDEPAPAPNLRRPDTRHVPGIGNVGAD